MALRLNFVLLIGLSWRLYLSYGHGDIGKNVTDLHLIGLFPLSGLWDGGQGMLPAAEMAVDDINNRSDILPGYRINMMSKDTGCDRGLGIKVFVDAIRQPATNAMIIGAGCSGVSQVIAQAAHHWNLVQISYISSAQTLSERRKFPNFFRILYSERVLNEARIQIFKLLNWTRVAVIYENEKFFTQMVENLEIRSKRANIKVINKGGFSEDPAGTIQRIGEEDARIIVGGFYTDKARKIFCAAYNSGNYGKQVWVTPDTIYQVKDWWNETDPSINCTADQLLKALQGTLVVSNVYTNMNETVEGLTRISLQSFRETFKERTVNMTQPVTAANEAPLAYDTVWAAAIALNKTVNNLKESGSEETLADFSYENKKMADVLKAKLHEVDFKSVSGPVAFSKGGEGIRLIGIDVFRGSDWERVGIYDRTKPVKDRLQLDIHAIWKGAIPRDSIKRREVIELVPVTTYAIMTSLASVGIALAVLFLSFNIFYRDTKIVRMSSPNINNIILVGCILAYVSVCIEDVNGTKNSIFCKVRTSLILLAFSLSFGALFAKTWRIHRIFTASRRLKKQIIKDASLCFMVLGLVCLNTLVLTTWYAFDAPIIRTDLKPHTEISDDIMIQYLYTYCSSNNENYFLITILTIQGIFLFLGVFLAWETRKVPFSIMNEFRYIGMCIYNVVTLGIVGAFVSLTLRSNTTLVYIVVSCATILSVTVTQCLLFVPKVLALWDYVHGKLTDANLTWNPTLDASLHTLVSRGINATTQTNDAEQSEIANVDVMK